MEPVYPSLSIWDYEWIMLILISNFYCSKTLPVRRYSLSLPGLFIKFIHQSWALLSHQPAILVPVPCSPNLNDCELALLKQYLPLSSCCCCCVICDIWETYHCSSQEGGCLCLLLQPMMHTLPGWLCQAGLQNHHLHAVPGSLFFSLPTILRPYLTFYLNDVFTPNLQVRSLLCPFMPFL